jgi:hypothetical protein
MLGDSIETSLGKFNKRLSDWIRDLPSVADVEASELSLICSYFREEEHINTWAQKFSVRLSVAMTNKFDRVNEILLRKEIVSCIQEQSKWQALKCLPFIPDKNRDRFLSEIDPLGVQHIKTIENGIHAFSFLLFLVQTDAPFLLNEKIRRTLQYRSLEIEVRKLAITYALIEGIKIDSAATYIAADSIFFDLTQQAVYSPESIECKEAKGELLGIVEETQNYFKSKFGS